MLDVECWVLPERREDGKEKTLSVNIRQFLFYYSTVAFVPRTSYLVLPPESAHIRQQNIHVFCRVSQIKYL